MPSTTSSFFQSTSFTFASEKLFFSEDNIEEVVIPAYEGEMGILKDHIPIISFLKPGILKLYNSQNKEEKFYIEDGVVEFNDNCLTVLTSKISDIKDLKANVISEIISESEKKLEDQNINDNERYLINQKIDTLKSISLN